MSQVDLGHGAKPPGYYVQRSYGLFPAPWPQEATELTQICHLFELLGLFVAKCIQDGRRVDLPLSRPFFKLMCTTAKSSTPDHVTQAESEDNLSPAHEEAESQPKLSSTNDNKEENEQSETSSTLSNQQQTSRSSSSISTGNGTASGDRTRSGMEAGLKEAELLATAAQAEISKDGSSKDVLTLEELSVSPKQSSSTEPWFSGILDNEDFAEVNPFRAKFLNQLDLLVQQRDEIMGDSSLEGGEKERRLAAVTLPGEQENIPGMKLEELW